MSAIVAIQKEKSLTLATDSRLTISTRENGEMSRSGQVDGVRKMLPVGYDKVLVQGSSGGLFRPEEHPGLMDYLAGCTVEEGAEALSDAIEEAGRELYVYLGGVSSEGPVFAGVTGNGVEVARGRNTVQSVGMEMLMHRLTRPVMYPDKAGGQVSPEDFIDMPVQIDPSTLSIGEAIDCAVFLLRFAGRYTEFLSGDDRDRALSGVNVRLDEDGNGARTIGGPIHTCTIVREGTERERTFHTFGTPHRTDQPAHAVHEID